MTTMLRIRPKGYKKKNTVDHIVKEELDVDDQHKSYIFDEIMKEN